MYHLTRLTSDDSHWTVITESKDVRRFSLLRVISIQSSDLSAASRDREVQILKPLFDRYSAAITR
eukprot:5030140-Pleurochrysis_carterae.AAC.2